MATIYYLYCSRPLLFLNLFTIWFSMPYSIQICYRHSAVVCKSAYGYWGVDHVQITAVTCSWPRYSQSLGVLPRPHGYSGKWNRKSSSWGATNMRTRRSSYGCRGDRRWKPDEKVMRTVTMFLPGPYTICAAPPRFQGKIISKIEWI